ncbi:MAG: FxsA family protein [Planctomycetota bacterium]
MWFWLLLLFVALPTTELWLLAMMGSAIGWPTTLLIALGTGVLGATLARAQGLATLGRITRTIAAGEPPADALMDGAMVLVAGAVLITPGVLTDAFGFSLLLPPVRAALKPLLRVALRRAVKRGVARGSVHVWTSHSTSGRGADPNVVDGQVVSGRIADEEPTRRR